MYVPENYSRYRYIVNYSDNYVVLSNRSGVSADWNNPTTIPVIIQYVNPSCYTIVANQTFNTSRDFTEVEVSSDFYSRSDCPQLITCIMSLIFFILFLFNGVTRIVKKGGIFFGQ